jgi:deoxyribodipyrimidine photolyase-related protein
MHAHCVHDELHAYDAVVVVTVLVLGDQLTRRVGPVAERDEPVLLVEAPAFARKLPYHPHKLVAVFSAMRHYRDALRADGRTVYYHQVRGFREGFTAHFESHPGDELVVMDPASHGAADRLRTLVEDCGGTLRVVENDLFLSTPDEFDEWAGDGSSDDGRTDGESGSEVDEYGELPTQETFYRWMRRRTGYLMDGDEPAGGAWNYDEDNRETPPADYDPPDPPEFEPDGTTREVESWVADTFDGGYDDPPYGGNWADPGPFRWPVTREGAERALDSFVRDRLPAFGDYQDAMRADEWLLHHSLLSVPLNLGLLHPREVIEAAIDACRERDLPLNSVEGFVRQVLGWREFMRHAYRREMPEMSTANGLEATEPLPDWYWTGDTDLACLSDVVDGVRTRGYSHHIERLMVLSNFATLLGVEPAALDRWFHAAYVDAFDWVTTPNVVGMGTFGTDAVSTKPYVSSANYIGRMGDYCDDCVYDPDATTGERACPFNALYWEFLDRNEDRLRSNHRMGLVYSHLDGKDDDERAAIRERAATVRERLEDGGSVLPDRGLGDFEAE